MKTNGRPKAIDCSSGVSVCTVGRFSSHNNDVCSSFLYLSLSLSQVVCVSSEASNSHPEKGDSLSVAGERGRGFC